MATLGQLLVRQGWASPDDIDRALTAQTAVANRLGTFLLERRVLGEDLLLKALCEQHQVPGAGVEDLRDIPDDVIATLSAKLAERCNAIPFRAFGTQIHVAMLDPRDLNSQDELAFALGKRVRPFVATEIRIREALERYYGVACPPQLKNLIRRLDKARYATPAGDRGAGAATTPAGARTRRLWEQPEAALFSEEFTRPAPPPPAAVASGGGAAAALATRPARPAAGQAPLQQAPEAQPTQQAAAAAPTRRPARPLSVPLTEKERLELQIADAASAAAAESLAEPAPTEASPGGPAVPPEPEGDDTQPIPYGAPPLPITFGDVEEQLANCQTPEEVARLVLALLSQHFERVALFKVLRDRIVGWHGAGDSLDAEALEDFSADFQQPSLFLNLRTAGSFYLGPLPGMAVHRALARCWGGAMPSECIVLPVRIHGRLVTAIYLDRGPDGLGKVDLDALLHLAVATAEAYERCILRKKKD